MCHQNNPDLQLWLREAKILQNLAKSGSLSHSLPVLRRLLNTQVFTNLSLTELKRNTTMIKRKHLLQLLAAESGYRSWADFKQHIVNLPEGTRIPSSIALRNAGYPVLWFPNTSEATLYTKNHGGKVVAFGHQAAVVPQQWEN